MLRIFTDHRCLEHRAPPGYPERPERLTGVLETLRAGDWDVVASPGGSAGPRAAVEAIHDPGYVARLEAAVERGDGLIDSADNPLSAGTWPAAWGAVECALEAVDWVMAGESRAAFAAVRPPGHHAERATAMGFCYFNAVAACAEHLRRRHGLERVAIVDFDVHHGNGTQHIFEERGDVLYVSLHQFPFYPGTGAAAERGTSAGVGATLNVPLPAGCGDTAYLEAFDRQVVPALVSFGPQMLLISAGFDAWQRDPLGGMRVTADGFERWGQRLSEAAGRICAGRSVSLLEGGYDLERLGELVERYLTGLAATLDPPPKK
ncbi:MAG: histone deacetylase [bacterium]|nr:histone deacetylase [bacterium]